MIDLPTLSSSDGAPQSLSELSSIPFPVPSAATASAVREPYKLTPILCNAQSISALLRKVISRSGLTPRRIAEKLGVSSNVIYQVLNGSRTKPSLYWFVKVAEVCGATLQVDLPGR